MIESLLCCPRCRRDLIGTLPNLRCADPLCDYHSGGFPVAANQPVLVDFDNSIFDRAAYSDGHGSVLQRDEGRQSYATRVYFWVFGENTVAAKNCERFLTVLKRLKRHPVALVIGGGAVGSGAEALYADKGISLIGTDVYASPHTAIVCDAHQLPFKNEVVDGVWIQAVLEHVLSPHQVVEEIFRVLVPGGIVYADTPFMQQVHEGAYDFSRFTLSGQRWMFRRFDQIQAGVAGGVSVSLLWSIRYFVRAFLGSRAGSLAALPFFWLRFIENWAGGQSNVDGASGTFFLGTKSHTTLHPKDMVGYYAGQAPPEKGRDP